MKRRDLQNGLSMVELSLGLGLLGATALLMVALLPASQEAAREAEVSDRVSSVHAALEGFAFIHARLPWADANGDGREDVGTVVGRLPYITLGLGAPLRNPSGLAFRYGVYVRPDAADPQQDVALTVPKDRFFPYIAEGLLNSDPCPGTTDVFAPCGAERRLGKANSLDFCFALGTALGQSINTGYLHVTANGIREHVAYVLVDPGRRDANNDGSPFDGRNSLISNNVEFEHPVTPASSQNDDTVYVRHFNALRERMGCTGVMAAVGHAHPNVETTVALFRQTMRDYTIQLGIAEEMAIADVLGATADVAGAASGLAGAVAAVPTTIASSLKSWGATAASAALAATAVALATANVVMAALNLDNAVASLAGIREIIEDADERIAELDALYWGPDGSLDHLRAGSIRYNVRQADELGVFNH